MRLEMVRLQIVGLRTCLTDTVHTLHSLGCVQIENIAEAGGAAIRPLQLDSATIRQQEALGFLVAKMEGLLAALRATDSGTEGARPDGQPLADCEAEARAGLEVLGPQVQALVSQREALEAEQASLPRYEATLRKLLPIVPASARAPANVSLGVLVNRAHLAVLDAIAERIVNLTGGRAEIVAEDVDSTTRAMLIVFPRELAGEVDLLVGREDLARLRLPEAFADQPPDVAVAALRQRLAAIPAELARLTRERLELAKMWTPRLEQWRANLRERLDEYAIFSQLGETEQTFVLAGWMPVRDEARVRAALAADVGQTVELQVWPLTPSDAKRAPVALINPGPARPFQSLVSLLALPQYDGIDPTVLMAFFLPLFFGMILGDVGYGVLLVTACLMALRRFRQPGPLRDLIQVLLMGAVWSIGFGFLYGEVFGTLGEHFGLRPLWLDRASPAHVAGLLLTTLAVGAGHVTLGLLLGVWEAARERSRNHLLERGGMLVGLCGLFVIVAVLVKWLPPGFMTPGLAVMLVGIVLLGASLGWLGVLMGPIEFIGLIGNILSYLRLAAIGLASIYLARVANDLAGSLGNLIVGVIIAVLIHALNFVLGAFSPTIHSLRLHYVEFFRKFYVGGGRAFAPFKSSIQSSVISRQ